MDREAWWATVHRVTRVRHTEQLTLSPSTKNYKVLLYSTANYVQCSVINHNAKEYIYIIKSLCCTVQIKTTL